MSAREVDETNRHRQVSHAEPGWRREAAAALAAHFGVSVSHVWALASDLGLARRLLREEKRAARVVARARKGT